MSDDDIYRKQQFGQKTGFGKLPALLVVDFVNGFHDPEILGGGNIPEAVIATVPLLDFFRATQRPVIFTRIVYAEDGSDAEPVVRKGAAAARPDRERRRQPGRCRARPASGRVGDPQDAGVGLLRHASRRLPGRPEASTRWWSPAAPPAAACAPASSTP